MRVRIFCTVILFSIVCCVKAQDTFPDKILNLPGYGQPKTPQFSGYASATATPCDDILCSKQLGIFYWFVAAPHDYAKKPIIVWTGGGPGSTAFYGFFYENGPYQILQNGSLRERTSSWSQFANYVIFDQPVGVGLSFVKKAEVSKNVAQGTEQFYYALQHFLAKHPELKNNPVYIASESYGGTYVPLLAIKILEENKKPQTSKINLRGIIVIDGWVDPIVQQSEDADYAFSHGIISLSQKRIIDAEYRLCHDTTLDNPHSVGASENCAAMLNSVRKFSREDLLNIGVPLEPDYQLAVKYLDKHAVRKAIHAKAWHSFELWSHTLFNNYQEGQQVSYAPLYEQLLVEHIPILIFSGLNDASDCNYLGTDAWLHLLHWPKDQAFYDAEQKVWKDSKTQAVLGYELSGSNLKWIKVLNAGHMVPMDQPKINQAVETFVKSYS